ncbi:MAG: ribosome silencing factor [Spirochaetia bacterium]|nr:ribosome silencing factor [Spirochaetia bacterium]
MSTSKKEKLDKTKNAKNQLPELLLKIAGLCEDNKAKNIVVLDLSNIHSYLSYFLIVTSLSSLHLKKVSSEVIHLLKENNVFMKVLPKEQDYESGWVILDEGEFIIHIFTEETRQHYNLEALWSKALSIKLKE